MHIGLLTHLQTFLSIPITQKCQILSCDTLKIDCDISLFISDTHTTSLKYAVEKGSLYSLETSTTNIRKKCRVFTFMWRLVKSVFFTAVTQFGPQGV